MTNKKSGDRKNKFVSVRKALNELRVNEQELKQLVEQGAINPVEEDNELMFSQEEIENYKLSAESPIDDESLYESNDGAYDSLFLTRSTIARDDDYAGLDNSLQEALQKKKMEEQNQDQMEAIKVQSGIIHAPKTTEFEPDEIEAMPEIGDGEKPASLRIRRRASTATRDLKTNSQGDSRAISALQDQMEASFLHIQKTLQKHTLILGGGLALLIVLSSLVLTPTTSSNKSVSNVPVVTLATIEEDTIQPEYSYAAPLMLSTKEYLNASVSGVVEKIRRSSGVVEPGTIVLTIANPELERKFHLLSDELKIIQRDLNQSQAILNLLRKKISKQEREGLNNLKKRIANLAREQNQYETFLENSFRLGETEEKRRQIFDQINNKRKDTANNRITYLEKMSGGQLRVYQAESEYKRALDAFLQTKSEYDSVANLRSKLQVRASVGGIVEVMVAEGQAVDSTTLLGKILDPEKKELLLDIPKRVAEQIRSGQQKEIKMEAFWRRKTKELSGTIQGFVPKSVTQDTLAIEVQGASELPKYLVVNLKLRLSEKTSRLVVPKKTVHHDSQSSIPYVFVALPDKDQNFQVRRMHLQTGWENQTMIEIHSTLEPGTQVVSNGKGMLLQDGAIVRTSSSKTN